LGTWLSPDRIDSLLAAYRIATPGSGLATGVESALAVAERVGYPVALKLAAAGVTHKSDVGGVALNIDTPEELRAEYEAMMARVRERTRGREMEVEGVHVQHMVEGVAELIVGVVRDPQFGPLTMAGVGGTGVELTRDVAFELAPLSARQAHDLLNRTGAGRLLAGFRGGPPADRGAVVGAILRLSQIALDWPEVQEIEINPLLVAGESSSGSAIAVDARVRVGPPA
jgi:acetyltransferase